ncbi:MAG: hypothetical protein ACR65R_01450 [Methylomicrobium sp.]
MNTKTLILSLFMTTAIGMSANASAAGVLDDTWYETQIKQTLPKVIDKKEVSQPSTWVTVKNFPIDTGKKTCYSHLIINTVTVPTGDYKGEVFCFIGSNWKHQSTFRVFDFADGNVGDEGLVVQLPALGSDLTRPQIQRISFEGTLILQPKLNNSGVLTNVKTFTTKQGSTDYQQNVSLGGVGEVIAGQDKTNLKFAWVKNPDKISNSNDLFACARSWETGNNLVVGCIDININNP